MRIAFFCHPTWAGCWTPACTQLGIGGSEEAVIHLAALLAERGHEVSVHIAGASGDRRFGAVQYSDYARLGNATIDVWVVWRRATLVDRLDAQGTIVRRLYLWLHDIVSTEVLRAYERRFHKIIVLSAYHRARFSQLGDERFLVSSNGIDPTQFRGPPLPRDPRLVVYGSDYGRGLRALLTSWATMKRQVPDLRLHVFYGWQGIERCDPERAERLKRTFAPLLAQPGISHLGRIGHAAVAEQYRRAGVWAYPCSWRETSCISAMKAQAGGAVPAVIPNGALRETVRFGYCTPYTYDDLAPGTSGQELIAQWREGVVDLVRHPTRQRRIRDEMMAVSRDAFAWERVASAWDREFASLPV